MQEEKVQPCSMCSEMVEELLLSDGVYWVCQPCADRYPSALVKAVNDDFFYALGLRSGVVLFFEGAEVRGEWVHLNMQHDGPKMMNGSGGTVRLDNIPVFCPRGVDVRLEDIVWVADAPIGS